MKATLFAPVLIQELFDVATDFDLLQMGDVHVDLRIHGR